MLRHAALAAPPCVPCQSSVCRKWLVSVPLLCGDSDSVGSVSGDPVSASYWALEPGCLGSSGFPAGRGGLQAGEPCSRPPGPCADGHRVQSAHGAQCRLRRWPGSHVHTRVHAHMRTHTPFAAHTHTSGTRLPSRKETHTLHPRARGRCAVATGSTARQRTAYATSCNCSAMRRQTPALREGRQEEALAAGGLAGPSWSGTRLYAGSRCRAKGRRRQKRAPPPGQTWPCCGARR